VTLVHRRPTLKPTIKYWVRPDIENRIKEGSIRARFSASVKEIRPTSVLVEAIPASAEDEAARARELAAMPTRPTRRIHGRRSSGACAPIEDDSC
jgi:hypothetical protein